MNNQNNKNTNFRHFRHHSFSEPSLLDEEEDEENTLKAATTTAISTIMDGKVIENLKITFPPNINLDELLPKSKMAGVSSKPPNSFIIYRKAFVKELNAQGYYFEMKKISSLVSAKWKSEPDYVKEAYRKIAKELASLVPPVNSQIRKSKRLNWVSVSTKQEFALAASHPIQLEPFQNTNKINTSTNLNYELNHTFGNTAKAHLPLPIDRRSQNIFTGDIFHYNFQIPANFSKMPSLMNNVPQSTLSDFKRLL
ncbi:6818_t:CDS:2 [Ambispora gerdemannii]|uniref:6818_t:CDS:1 n=1 Tax=Ambispora gerdemannii TaxID=144530 RepID=A0A9N9GDM3_9GLOM|nr:6818_t:CDS:2 [Ambispora gerdemannii]